MKGVEGMNIDDVYSTSEAAKIWGVSTQTVKTACLGQKGLPPRFEKGEYRKSGRVWLVTRSGMERLFSKKQSKD